MKKAERKEIKKTVKELRSVFCHIDGITFMFVPTCRGHAKVTWAIMGDKDVFDKWIGRRICMNRFFRGLSLPTNIMPETKEEAKDIGYIIFEAIQ